MRTRSFTLALGTALVVGLTTFRAGAGTAFWTFDDWNDPALQALVIAGDATTILQRGLEKVHRREPTHRRVPAVNARSGEPEFGRSLSGHR